jgi:hypothetical protein
MRASALPYPEKTMIVDPQIRTPWELGLFMLAPLSFGMALGALRRWRDKRLRQSGVEEAWATPNTPTITLASPARPLFESVEGHASEECDCHESAFQTKDVA